MLAPFAPPLVHTPGVVVVKVTASLLLAEADGVTRLAARVVSATAGKEMVWYDVEKTRTLDGLSVDTYIRPDESKARSVGRLSPLEPPVSVLIGLAPLANPASYVRISPAE